ELPASGDGEVDLRRRRVHVEPGLDEKAEIAREGRERERELVDRARAGLGIGRGVDSNGAHRRPPGARVGGELAQVTEGPTKPALEQPVRREGTERIHTEAHAQLRL